MTVENRIDDAVLTAMDNVLIPRVEMVVRSTNGPSRNGSNSVVQDPDRRDFIGNTESTPLKLASSRFDLSIDQNTIDVTHDNQNFGYGVFTALKPNYVRQAHTYHMLADITPLKIESLSFSQDVQLKAIHCHSNSLNCKTWQHTFHPATYCQWLSKHRGDKTQTQATISTELPRQLHVMQLNNDPTIRQHYSSQQQRRH